MKLIVYVICLVIAPSYTHTVYLKKKKKSAREEVNAKVYLRKREYNKLSELQNLLPFKRLSALAILAISLTESLLPKKVITNAVHRRTIDSVQS